MLHARLPMEVALPQVLVEGAPLGLSLRLQRWPGVEGTMCKQLRRRRKVRDSEEGDKKGDGAQQ